MPAATAAGSAAVHAHRSANRHRQDKYLGAAWSPGTASLNFANYWNQVTPENGGKWGSVEGTRDVMNWTQADAAYALAKANGFPFKWHTFIWGNQQPAWIESLPTAEQREEIEEWYAAVAARYPEIDQIEVVNEPLHDPPRGATNGNYIEALGGNGVTGWDWIITSFQLARQYFPNAELILNDYSITNDGNATTNYITIINLLKERGLIDAIGDQAHAFSTTEAAPMNNHKNNLNRLAATGLPIYITELDIDGVLAGRGQRPGAGRELPAHLPDVLGASGRQGRNHLGLRAWLPLAQRTGRLAAVSERRRASGAAVADPLCRQHSGGGGFAVAHGE